MWEPGPLHSGSIHARIVDWKIGLALSLGYFEEVCRVDGGHWGRGDPWHPMAHISWNRKMDLMQASPETRPWKEHVPPVLVCKGIH